MLTSNFEFVELYSAVSDEIVWWQCAVMKAKTEESNIFIDPDTLA